MCSTFTCEATESSNTGKECLCHHRKFPWTQSRSQVRPHGLGQMKDGCRLFRDPLALFLGPVHTGTHEVKEGFQSSVKASVGKAGLQTLSDLLEKTGGTQDIVIRLSSLEYASHSPHTPHTLLISTGDNKIMY